MRLDAIDPASVHRARLGEHGLGVVETLQVMGPRGPKPRAEDYSPDYQICLPYRGLVVWHVGHDAVVADPNRVLFVAGDEAFRFSQPAGRWGPSPTLRPLVEFGPGMKHGKNQDRPRVSQKPPGLHIHGQEVIPCESSLPS